MKIVLATNNRHKIEEIRSFLPGVEILSLDQFDPIELKEEGSTLRDNALQKARIVAQASGEWALADDTGLFVPALGGRPGVFSSRYAGQKATDEENIFKLLGEMKDLAGDKREAYFSCVMALVHPDGREVTVEGRLQGQIAKGPKGNRGFGYDPIFWLPDRGCTLAELSLEEKNKVSHRGRALDKMRGVLEGLIKLENSMRK